MPDITLSGQSAHRQSDQLWVELNEAKRQLANCESIRNRMRNDAAEVAEMMTEDREEINRLRHQLASLRAAARATLDLFDRFPMQTALLMRQDEVLRLRKEMES